MPMPARADRLDLLTGKSSRSRRSHRNRRRRHRRVTVGLAYLTVSRAPAADVLRPKQKKKDALKEGEGANTGSCFVFARNP